MQRADGRSKIERINAKGALLEAGRVLRVGGRLAASLIHLCFDTGEENSCWVAERYAHERRVFRKVGRYRELFEHGAQWRVGGREDPQARMETPYYHRPHSWYFRALKAEGLAVTALEEPEPTEEFVKESPQGAYLREVPLHCVIEAHKLGT